MKKLKFVLAALMGLSVAFSAYSQSKKKSTDNLANTSWVYEYPGVAKIEIQFVSEGKCKVLTRVPNVENIPPFECKYTYARSNVTIHVAEATKGQQKDWTGEVKEMAGVMNLNFNTGTMITFNKVVFGKK